MGKSKKTLSLRSLSSCSNIKHPYIKIKDIFPLTFMGLSVWPGRISLSQKLQSVAQQLLHALAPLCIMYCSLLVHSLCWGHPLELGAHWSKSRILLTGKSWLFQPPLDSHRLPWPLHLLCSFQGNRRSQLNVHNSKSKYHFPTAKPEHRLCWFWLRIGNTDSPEVLFMSFTITSLWCKLKSLSSQQKTGWHSGKGNPATHMESLVSSGLAFSMWSSIHLCGTRCYQPNSPCHVGWPTATSTLHMRRT